MVASFLQKPLGAVAALGTAIGAPYAIFETDAGTSARVAVQQMMSPSSGASANADPALGAPGSQQQQGANPTVVSYGPATVIPMSADGSAMWMGGAMQMPMPAQMPMQSQAPMQTPMPQSVDVREFIRFDMTPTLLTQRFPQVTSLPPTSNLDGMRVAAVTGTQPTDIAGTLSYYFDANKAVQRIQFYGHTGDPSMIAGMMVQYYRLQPEPALGGQLYTIKWNNRITSMLHVAPAPVIQAGASHANYTIVLEINQPSVSYGLSEEASSYLAPFLSRR